MHSEKRKHAEVFYYYSDVACPFRRYLVTYICYLVAGGVGERIDSTGHKEEDESAGEKESCSTDGSREYETESEEVNCYKDWHNEHL